MALPVRSEKAVVIGILNGGEEGSTALILKIKIVPEDNFKKPVFLPSTTINKHK